MLSPTHLRREGEDYEAQILSKAVKAGRRTYFFDVRATRGDDYFLTITESRKITAPDGTSSYDRHKIFLYKEDFSKFADGLHEVVEFIRRSKACPEPEEWPVPIRFGARGNRPSARFRRKMRRSPATAPGRRRTLSRTGCPRTCRGEGKRPAAVVWDECAPCAARHSERSGADCGKSLRDGGLSARDVPGPCRRERENVRQRRTQAGAKKRQAPEKLMKT